MKKLYARYKLFIILLLVSGVLSLKFSTPDYQGDYGDYKMDGAHPSLKSYNALFASSEECIQCHGHDTLGIASVDGEGTDVNVVDHWQSTMMANAAKDPFWRAKVSHEVLLFPELKSEIESSCTDCHAPLGFFNAKHLGATEYTIEDMLADSLALDGVSCLACHQQSDEDLARFFSGQINIDTNHVAYGQYMSPLISPMAAETGYIPEHSEHIEDAGICGSCHTLITESLDENGNPLNNSFVEQATYHEWLNSIYNEENTTCQQCHMPSLGEQGILIAAGYETVPRSPFYLHQFAGANVQMLQILKDNIDTLQLNATPEEFDYTIQSTKNMLQFNTLQIELSLIQRTSDTSYFEVFLQNMAGHKFPSGYPSRRAVVQFYVEDNNGDTLFESGKYNPDFSLTDEDVPYEPHYQVINQSDQVQIYEIVMYDNENNFTTILNRAFAPIKDNRLVPFGFSTSHSVYDTTFMAGNVLDDSDFNYENGVEGSGSDRLFYNIPMDDYVGTMTATVSVQYQTIHPLWLNQMFSDETPEINLFKQMVEEADLSPVFVASETIEVGILDAISVIEPEPDWIQIIQSENIVIELKESATILLYDVQGKLLDKQSFNSGNNVIKTNISSGIIILVAVSESKKKFVKRLLILDH